jgi:oligopeptide transport system ATP-binding protein
MMEPVMRVESLVKHFAVSHSKKPVQAVTDVSFAVERGETLGLVGESGSGKTTVGRCVLRLIEPTSGRIFLNGRDMVGLSDEGLRALRPKMQLVFQEPFDSLDPQMNVGRILAEPLRLHTKLSKAERQDHVVDLLEKVGLSGQMASWYPHQMAAGQQQRVGIARAIATQPFFLVLDEPVSSLDPTARAEIVDLLLDLQERLGIAYLFISHDLTTVRHFCHWIAVMYLGRIVEMSPTEQLFERAVHPYTRALLSAVPVPDPEVRQPKFNLVGEIPSPINLPSGCHLHARCPSATAECRNTRPELELIGDRHWVACLRARELGLDTGLRGGVGDKTSTGRTVESANTGHDQLAKRSS